MILLSTLLCLPAWGVELHSRHYTTQDGLVSNTIRFILQDSIGYIWMGTTNGLCRYDGYDFVNFRLGDNPATALIDQRVMNLRLHPNGLLWIGSSADVFSCYDTKKERFVCYTAPENLKRHYNNCVIDGENSWLYGRNDGCMRCWQEGDSVLSEVLLPKSQGGCLSDAEVHAINPGTYQSKKGCWICTHDGLYFWQDGEIQVVSPDLAWHTVVNSCAVSGHGEIFEISPEGTLLPISAVQEGQGKVEVISHFEYKGLLYFYTKRQCYTYNPQTRELLPCTDELYLPHASLLRDSRGWIWLHNLAGTLIGLDPKSGETVHMTILTREQSRMLGEQISVCHGSHGIVWISVYGNGLFAYNKQTHQVEHILANEHNSFGLDLVSNNVKYVSSDRSGSLWIGYEYGGLSHLVPFNNEGVHYIYPAGETNEAPNENYIRMITSEQGHFWMGNRGRSLFELDENLSVVGEDTFPAPPYSIAYDGRGTRYVATRSSGIDIGGELYRNVANDSESLGYDKVYALHADHAGRVWVGTFGRGLDLALSEMKEGKPSCRFLHFFNHDYGAQNVRSIKEDAWGRLWVATGTGLRVFNPDRLIADSTDYFSVNMEGGFLASNDVRSIYIDSKQRIYLSESGVGFAMAQLQADDDKLQQLAGNLRHYRMSDGLVNDVVQGFVEDLDGDIWIATEYGLSRFDPNQESFQSFFPSADMRSNVFCENTATRLPDGLLLFGTCHGAAVINPKQMKSIESVSDIHLTLLEIGSDNVTIHFSAFDYSSATPVKYSYLLEDYDGDWSRYNEINEVVYRHLAPGTYRLHVRGVNAAGCQHPEAVFQFDIPTPWWRTWWAITLFVLIALAIIYYVVGLTREHIRLQRQIRLEEERYEQKIVYLTNMLHELRAPINLVKGALEHTSHAPVSEEYVATVKDLIDQHAKMVEELPQRAIADVEQRKEAPERVLTEADKKFVEQLEKTIESQLSNADFTVDDFASCLCMGRTAFFRRVKEVTGYSPKEYLRIARMQKAAELLATSGQTVSEIAYMVGINDPFYFCRCFKQQFGMAPSAYLKEKNT